MRAQSLPKVAHQTGDLLSSWMLHELQQVKLQQASVGEETFAKYLPAQVTTLDRQKQTRN